MADPQPSSIGSSIRKHWIYLLLQTGAFALAVWWIPVHRLPLPGYAVAVIAVLAAVMSIHPDMKWWMKLTWMLLIGLFLRTELRAISKDRKDSERQALAERKEQSDTFHDMRTAENDGFKATAQGLTDALSGIRGTLKASNATLLATQPHAGMRFDRFEFVQAPSTNFQANTPYAINVYTINSGTAEAVNTKVLEKAYIAIADDKDAQDDLVRKFEKDWQTEAKGGGPPVAPNTSQFATVYATMSKNDLDSPRATFYILGRVEYSDLTGRWRTDYCRLKQRNADGISTTVDHWCKVFEHYRYPAP
jgi:hypothetical protein